VIASGALLIGIAPARAGSVAQQIRDQGISCTRIGEFREQSYGVRLDDAPMPRFDSDELTKLFSPIVA
jgi:hydrogenase maturation factor